MLSECEHDCVWRRVALPALCHPAASRPLPRRADPARRVPLRGAPRADAPAGARADQGRPEDGQVAGQRAGAGAAGARVRLRRRPPLLHQGGPAGAGARPGPAGVRRRVCGGCSRAGTSAGTSAVWAVAGVGEMGRHALHSWAVQSKHGWTLRRGYARSVRRRAVADVCARAARLAAGPRRQGNADRQRAHETCLTLFLTNLQAWPEKLARMHFAQTSKHG
jgi:hypothetical protein